MKRIITLLLIVIGFGLLNQVSAQVTATDSLKQSVNELSKAVEVLKKIKITGWVQAQYQWAESKGADNFDGGDFGQYSDQRFMIRRGRVKFTYTQKITQFVLQINGTERGLNLVEIFAKVYDPWKQNFALTAGVMNRPFGFEIEQSSAIRETPERSRYTQILMPNERDLGAKLTYEPKKGQPLYGLKIDAGFYNGQGIAVPGTNSATGSYANDGVNEFDFVKDFIGRAAYYRSTNNEKYRYGIGFSHYSGGIVYQSDDVYEDIENGVFVKKDLTGGKTYKGKSAPRKYYGAEAFFSVKSKLGLTTIRGEYIWGTQPGVIDNTRSASSLPGNTATYLRKFDGSYAYLIQRIGKTKSEFAVKYEWYDPNTRLAGKELESTTNKMTKAEVKYTALGLGYNYYYDENVKFMFYYNIVTNENTLIDNYTNDRKDDIFTLRMQYRF